MNCYFPFEDERICVLMCSIIYKFGADVKTEIADAGHSKVHRRDEPVR